MNIGIVGAGSIANIHAKTILSCDNAILAGIYDNTPEKRESFAKTYKTKAFDDYDSLLNACDAVIVATPNSSHLDYSLEALKKKKHVLCEKPLATSLNDANKMLESVPSGVVASVGFNYRFLPIVRLMRELVLKNSLERIQKVSLCFLKDSAILKKDTFSWRDSSSHGNTSGSLGDLGIHLIDLLHFIVSKEIRKDSLKGILETRVPQKGGQNVAVDDFAHVFGEFEDGPAFEIKTSKSSPEEKGVFLEILGDDFKLSYNSNNPEVYIFNNEEIKIEYQQVSIDPEREIFGWADSFLHQLNDWVEQMQENAYTGKGAKFNDGVWAQKAFDVIYGSISK